MTYRISTSPSVTITINQQKHQFALLLKSGLYQTLLNALTEGFNGRHQASHFPLVVDLGQQFALLLS